LIKSIVYQVNGQEDKPAPRDSGHYKANVAYQTVPSARTVQLNCKAKPPRPMGTEMRWGTGKNGTDIADRQMNKPTKSSVPGSQSTANGSEI